MKRADAAAAQTMTTRRGARRASWSLFRSWAAYAALPVVGIATAPALARALGPQGRGQLAGILQPMTIASAVAILGAPSAVTYFLASGAPRGEVLRRARTVAVGTTLIVAVVLVFYSQSVSRNLGANRTVTLAIWCAFIPSAFVAIRRAELQAGQFYGPLDFERASSGIMRAAAVVGLFFISVRAVTPYAVAYMATGLLASAYLYLPRHTAPLLDRPRVRQVSLHGFHRFALLASLGTIAGAMNSRLDQAIMPANTSAVELGYYSAAVAVAEAPMIVAAVVSRNVLAEASSGASAKRIYTTIAIGGTAVVAGCAALAFILPWAVPVAFGSDFSPTIGVARVLLLSTVAQYFADSQSALLAGTRAPGLSSIASVVAILVTVGLFAIMWHSMDAMKAAWISAIGQFASVAIGGSIATRRMRVHRQSLHEGIESD